jgi:hypothetical protein
MRWANFARPVGATFLDAAYTAVNILHDLTAVPTHFLAAYAAVIELFL